jgi:hypothetical protein
MTLANLKKNAQTLVLKILMDQKGRLTDTLAQRASRELELSQEVTQYTEDLSITAFQTDAIQILHSSSSEDDILIARETSKT